MELSDEEKHARSVGALIVNLQSLEFLLRGFLSTVHDADPSGLLPGMPRDLTSLTIGQSVPENHMTNYDGLESLVDKYNTYMSGKNPSLLLDKQVVVLRDALAHGRVFQEVSRSEFQLLKFDRPVGGAARVVFSETMDSDWFKHRAELVITQVSKVFEACKSFAPTMIV